MRIALTLGMSVARLMDGRPGQNAPKVTSYLRRGQVCAARFEAVLNVMSEEFADLAYPARPTFEQRAYSGLAELALT
jgi:hypothetical protein